MRSLARELHSSMARATILITHDVGEAMPLADRLAIMSDGAIVCYGIIQ